MLFNVCIKTTFVKRKKKERVNTHPNVLVNIKRLFLKDENNSFKYILLVQQSLFILCNNLKEVVYMRNKQRPRMQK